MWQQQSNRDAPDPNNNSNQWLQQQQYHHQQQYANFYGRPDLMNNGMRLDMKILKCVKSCNVLKVV